MAKHYWIFNIDRFPKSVQADTETLTWEQKRRFLGQKGDEALILESFGFTSVYILDEVTMKPVQGQQNDLLSIIVTLKLKEKFSEKKELYNYLYSFPRIKYFDEEVKRQFTSKYNRMNKLEFEAVELDDIFFSRSMLGTAINSMHIDHRRAFVKYLVNKYPEAVVGKLPFELIAENVIEYIKASIIIPARHLQLSTILLRKVVGDEVYNQVGFQTGSLPRIIDRIPSQITQIESHLKTVEQLESFLTQAIKQDAELIVMPEVEGQAREPVYIDRQKENKFENLFKNKYLPIEL